jgi:hypothetical protein
MASSRRRALSAPKIASSVFLFIAVVPTMSPPILTIGLLEDGLSSVCEFSSGAAELSAFSTDGLRLAGPLAPASSGPKRMMRAGGRRAGFTRRSEPLEA